MLRNGLIITSIFFISNGCYGQLPRTAQSDDCGIIEESPNDIRTQVPWVAAIFARSSTKHKFEYYITGTVIGPTTILTIFAGAYGEPITKGGKYFISPSFNYKVGVGVKTNSLDDLDGYSQVSEVSYIIPFTGHDPDNKEYHFFIFHLKTSLNLKTPYVRAVCIPILAKIFGSGLLEKVQLKQGGFSVSALSNGSNALQVIEVGLSDTGYCSDIYSKFYTGKSQNLYCANVTEANVDNNLGCILHGSAPVAPLFNNRWFMIGITALIPKLDNASHWCNKNTVYFYGRLLKTIDWIENNIKCGPTKFACGDGECIPLKMLCDKKSDCLGSEDEDPIFCRARRPCIYDGKSHECGVYGECIRPTLLCDGTPNCADGSDENPSTCRTGTILTDLVRGTALENAGRSSSQMIANNQYHNGFKQNVQKCPVLQLSEGVEIHCRNPLTGDRVACNEATPGTIANFRCQNYYKFVYRLPTTETKCNDDGTWRPRRPFGCEPDCGILSMYGTSELIPFIIGGQSATNAVAFPWHSAIFFRKKDAFEFICGGSLIEKSVIITAAHCVTDSSGVIRTKQNFKIALGSISSTFKDIQNIQQVQIFNALNIWVPATYDRRNLQSDIALIQLDKPTVFGEYVRPICYFSQGGQALPNPGDIGRVSGLGFVNDTSISEKLMFASFPVISTTECTKALKIVPPLSTFCAGYQNGTAVCQGDSGGGMVFPEPSTTSNNRYILKGIVSHGEVIPGKLCNPNNYAVFTHVDAYADWILQRLEGTLRK